MVGGFGLCSLMVGGCYPQQIAAPENTPPRVMEVMEVMEVRSQQVSDSLSLIGRIEPWRETTLYFHSDP